jgi:hypothetical protein
LGFSDRELNRSSHPWRDGKTPRRDRNRMQKRMLQNYTDIAEIKECLWKSMMAACKAASICVRDTATPPSQYSGGFMGRTLFHTVETTKN